MKRWRAIQASVRGNWHEQSGQKNQDAVRLLQPSGRNGPLLLAVADGHGSARSFRSDRGSRFATEAALRQFRRFFQRYGDDAPLHLIRQHMATRWMHDVILDWKASVRADVGRDPFSFLEFAAWPEKPPVIRKGADFPGVAYLAYGATLLVTAITRDHFIYGQLGDGDILAIEETGEVRRPLRRHHFHALTTVSLCTPMAWRDFQVRVEPRRANAPAAIMLSTDGYANCFSSDTEFFQVGVDLLRYLRTYGIEAVEGQLESWLRESSRDGSGDDITVGLAARCDALDGRPA
jgi:hypothetical protein